MELDPLAESLNGHSGGINFNKLGGLRTRGNVGIGYKSPGFDPNDVGFMRRADHIPQNAWFQVRFPEPGKYVRNININFNQWSSHNFDGDRLDLGFNFNAHWQFQNQWSTGFGVNYNVDGFDDRLTRGGPGGRFNGNINSWQYFNTNDRKLLSLAWNSNFGNDRRGSRWWNLDPRIVIRPKTAWFAEFGVGYNDSHVDAQWVNSVEDGATTRYVFGRLEQGTTTITTRFNYTLTPTLSLQVYAQPFISSGVYQNYKELVQPKADYKDRYAPYDYSENADFNVLSFRTTNVLRWEYKPGSAFFVVWQQGREGFAQHGSANFGRDFDDLFNTPVDEHRAGEAGVLVQSVGRFSRWSLVSRPSPGAWAWSLFELREDRLLVGEDGVELLLIRLNPLLVRQDLLLVGKNLLLVGDGRRS